MTKINEFPALRDEEGQPELANAWLVETDQLKTMAVSSDAKDRLRAAEGLRFSNNEEGKSILLSLTDDEDPQVSEQAVESLATFPGADIDARLLKIITLGKVQNVRAAASKVLSQRNTAES